MISTVLQTAYYQGDGTTSGDKVIRLKEHGLGPSNVTMQAMLTSVFSGGAPVSASAYIEYYMVSGRRIVPGPTPGFSDSDVTEVGMAVELQGGNGVTAALLVFVSA